MPNPAIDPAATAASRIDSNTYNALTTKYPACVIHALTDDLPAAFPLPKDSNPDSWRLCYDGIADFLEDYDKLANPLGIFRHAEKGKILMPETLRAPNRTAASANSPKSELITFLSLGHA